MLQAKKLGATGLKEQILKTAKVLDRKGLVYSIGSFGGRVNFYAQQNRALNLVWALYEDGQLRPAEDAVAVIGCGVTGITLAAGLVALGCRVDVFESGDASIHRQVETQHRMAHPTINYWPDVAPDLTTTLPFLEWHFGQCDKVADSLLVQFEELRANYEAGKEDVSQILVGVTADKIIEVAAKLVMVKTGGDHEKVYRLAIIAVGFGKESPQAPYDADPYKTPEYWASDDVEKDRNAGTYTYHIVSGAGDGGLIDALRVAHPDFDHGRLAFEVAAALYDERCDQRVVELIKKGEKVAADAKTHNALALEAVYAEAAGLITDDPAYAEIHEKLWASLKKFKRLVYVTDHKLPVPFSRNAAPIHKLMMAHAKRNSRVEYATGPVVEEGDNFSIGGQRLPKAKTKVIIRHGANPEPDLQLLLTVPQFEDLKAKQGHLADHVIEHHWAPFPCFDGMVEHDTTSDAFRDSRRDMAEDAVRQVDARAHLLPVKEGFEVTFRKEVPPTARGPLFGIATNYIPASVSTGLGG